MIREKTSDTESEHTDGSDFLMTSRGKYDKIKYVSDVSGMWAQIKRTKDLKFSKNETKQIAIIQKILQTKQITPMTIFEVGLYPVSVAATILEIPKSQITKMYKK